MRRRKLEDVRIGAVEADQRGRHLAVNPSYSDCAAEGGTVRCRERTIEVRALRELAPGALHMQLDGNARADVHARSKSKRSRHRLCVRGAARVVGSAVRAGDVSSAAAAVVVVLMRKQKVWRSRVSIHRRLPAPLWWPAGRTVLLQTL
jgi:hypothetical protein